MDDFLYRIIETLHGACSVNHKYQVDDTLLLHLVFYHFDFCVILIFAYACHMSTTIRTSEGRDFVYLVFLLVVVKYGVAHLVGVHPVHGSTFAQVVGTSEWHGTSLVGKVGVAIYRYVLFVTG